MISNEVVIMYIFGYNQSSDQGWTESIFFLNLLNKIDI